MSSNPFEVLGLDRSATFEDVQLAYRRLARQYHPDANPHDPLALERFTALRRAYDRLKGFYQTRDEADSATRPAPPSAIDSPPPPNAARQTPNADAATPDSAGTGAAAPEPPLPGTGNRRAFRRAGPLQQSGDLAGRSVAPQGPTTASRASTVRLPTPQQVGGGHLAARAEIVYGRRTVAPSTAPQMVYALLGLRASEGVVFPRVPLNLCFVLDHSSSMLRGGKVERLKETVRGIIEQLDDDDFLSIVTFGDRAEVVLPAQPVRNKALMQGAIDAMRCRGGTEISRGLAVGLSELARNASRALSHLILLTDGQTYGDEMACLQLADEAAAAAVGITAYGLGDDWNSALLDGIAGPSGGHSDYIASPAQMAPIFSARVQALQSTTLRQVVLSTQPAAAARVQRATLVGPLLRPLDLAAEHGILVSRLGDISSSTDYRVLLEVVLGPCQPGTVPVADLTLCYAVPGLQREAETLPIPLAVTVTPDHDPSVPVDPRVTEALRHITVHRLQQQAWAEINRGDRAKGTGLLKRAAEHLEVAGHGELATIAATEAVRVEGGEAASDQNVKRIIYGTRKLG
jgi:Ca-activated chloride channel family protein